MLYIAYYQCWGGWGQVSRPPYASLALLIPASGCRHFSFLFFSLSNIHFLVDINYFFLCGKQLDMYSTSTPVH